MTAWVPTARRFGDLDAHRVVAPILIVAASLVVSTLVVNERTPRLAIAGVVLLLALGLGFTSPRRLLYFLVCWLAVLGLVRRLVSSSGTDPLLLAEPMALGVLVLMAVKDGAFRARTRLANYVFALSVLFVAGTLNPLQRSLIGGLAGLIFTVVPMLAFWVGRRCEDRTLKTVLVSVAILALPAAGYGLYQVFSGFPSWDRAWINAHPDYTALYVPTYVNGVYRTTLRPFGPFTAASEYAYFVFLAITIWLILLLRFTRMFVVGGAVALLGVAAIYQSSRGVVVALVATLGLIGAAYHRLALRHAAVIGAATVLLIPFVVSRAFPNVSNTNASSALVAHQVQGLADPLNPKHSTLGLHVEGLVGGLRSAIEEPVGLGTGSVSIAAAKFGGVERGTEADPSNVAVALGLPGLLVYFVVMVLGFVKAYQVASRSRSRLAFAALGVLAVMNFQWLNGGNYAVAFLPWLVLGWVDRQAQRSDAVASTGPEPVPEGLVVEDGYF